MSWLRIQLTGDRPVCHVVGIGHHSPTVRSVPLATATALAAAGVATVVHRRPASASETT